MLTMMTANPTNRRSVPPFSISGLQGTEWPDFAVCGRDNCQLVAMTSHRWLWLSNVAVCKVRKTHTSLGDRSFTVAGLCLCNNLPLHLRDSELALLEFRQLSSTLHIYLFTYLSYSVVVYWQPVTRSTPAVPNCCCPKDSVPCWSNPPFLIFDILALWRSGLSARAPECQKLKMVG